MSIPREQSSEHADNLLRSFLQCTEPEQSERLLGELLACAAPLIESRLGRRFRVSMRGGRCPQNPDAEDQYNEVNALLVEKLRNLKASPAEAAIVDFQSYVAQVAENSFRNRLREDHKQLRSLRDGLRYLLGGRTPHKIFALWRSESDKLVCGFTHWNEEGSPPTPKSAYQQLLDDPVAFAGAKLPDRDVQRIGRAELVDLIFRWVGGPVAFDDLVSIIAVLQAMHEPFPATLRHTAQQGEAAGEYAKAIEDAPDQTPTPLASLESKSDMQMVWADLERLTVEQRRVLLLQAQHDVIEILLRAGVTTIGEIAAALEMPVEEIEQLRIAGFLSDEQLGRRFRSLKATIMQQRNRARNRMVEWRKRW